MDSNGVNSQLGLAQRGARRPLGQCSQQIGQNGQEGATAHDHHANLDILHRGDITGAETARGQTERGLKSGLIEVAGIVRNVIDIKLSSKFNPYL